MKLNASHQLLVAFGYRTPPNLELIKELIQGTGKCEAYNHITGPILKEKEQRKLIGPGYDCIASSLISYSLGMINPGHSVFFFIFY